MTVETRSREEAPQRGSSERAVAELRRELERYRFALEASDTSAWEWDPVSDEVFHSGNAARILGLRSAAVPRTGEEFFALLHPDDQARVRAALRRALDETADYDEEFRMVRPDGSVLWVADKGRVLPGRPGQASRLSGVLVDITRRRQAEEEVRNLNATLRRQAEELQAVLDVLPVGVFIADDPDCASIRANPAGARMLGIEVGVNASKSGPHGGELPFRVLCEGEEIAAQDLPMQRAARTGEAIHGEESDILHAQGQVVRLLEHALPLFDEQGRIRGCVGAFIDITEYKKVEEALQEADRRKDEFLATLAHELRNPLAPIRNAVRILQLQGIRDPQLRSALGVIERQVEQLTRLVDDLLDVSRITRGKLELRKERVELSAVVERALETSRPLIAAARHELTVRLPREPIHLEADATRLAQVLANLLNNAAKYTRAGGHIELGAERAGGEVLLRVRDDGEGIPPEMLPCIFEMFTQVDASLERAQGGLGIGLTIVKRLVEMHGGEITAASGGPGQGSEFTVRLPLGAGDSREAPARDEGSDAGPPRDRPPRRILVVDDNRDAAETLAMLLELWGDEARVAHDGPEALEVAERYRPDAVLLDIGMPGMNGYEVARRLREREEMREVLLVAMTGWGQEADRQRSREAGFDHHLVKPPDPEVLEALLHPEAH